MKYGFGGAGGEGASQQAKLRQNKWINRQVTKVANDGNLHDLLDTSIYYLPQMNSINLVTALHRVTKLVASGRTNLTVEKLLEKPQFNLLWQTVTSKVELHLNGESQEEGAFEVQCMSLVCWSCATLRLYASDILNTISEIASPRLHEMKPFELSNMVWAYAKLQLGQPKFYEAVSDRVLQRQAGEFSLQCISMIAWSFASVKNRDLPLFASLSKEMTDSLLDIKPQEISNSLWAYAKISCPYHALFMALADVACEKDFWQFKPQELSNTVWAFATSLIRHNLLFEKVAKVAIAKRSELLPQNCANILWAYAKLQVGGRDALFRALLEQTIMQLPRHNPQEMSAIVWAAVREADPIRKTLFDAVAAHWSGYLKDFSLQALANMVKAFVTAGGPMSFVEEMTNVGMTSLYKFDKLGLVTLFHGLVLVYMRHDKPNWATKPVKTVARRLEARIHKFENKELTSLNHTIALLDWSGKPPHLQELVALHDTCMKTAKMRGLPKRKAPKTAGPKNLDRDAGREDMDYYDQNDCDDDDNAAKNYSEGMEDKGDEVGWKTLGCFDVAQSSHEAWLPGQSWRARNVLVNAGWSPTWAVPVDGAWTESQDVKDEEIPVSLASLVADIAPDIGIQEEEISDDLGIGLAVPNSTVLKSQRRKL